jgi:hypothetical protein
MQAMEKGFPGQFTAVAQSAHSNVSIAFLRIAVHPPVFLHFHISQPI